MIGNLPRERSNSVALQIIVIAISLSIDALGIGIAYPLRGVKLDIAAKGIIGLISCIVMYLSIFVGKQMTKIIPADVLMILGTSLLVLMGVIYIRNSLFSDEEANYDFFKEHPKELIHHSAIVLSIDEIETVLQLIDLNNSFDVLFISFILFFSSFLFKYSIVIIPFPIKLSADFIKKSK